MIRVYAIYARSTLFEVTFQPIDARTSFVEYRRGYDGHGTEAQTWALLKQCVHELTPAIAPSPPTVSPK